MLALKITDIKDFTNKLLAGDTFDSFCMVESTVTTFNTFTIDGTLHLDFFDTDTCNILNEKSIHYSFWKDIRPFFYSIIRGKRVPLNFKIVLGLSQNQIASVAEKTSGQISPKNIHGLYFNIQYKNEILLCTTGTSLKIFFPDKSLEQAWDAAVLDFLHKHQILFEEL